MSRVLLYAQHLSGVGHHVRTELLARGLARRHEVWVVDGGAPVPRRPSAVEIGRVPLPRIRRGEAGLVPLDGSDGIAAVLAARADALEAAVRRLRPDAVVVEHFPFSKWELAGEILRMLDAARAVSPRAPMVCSIRDVVWKTRHDPGDEREHAARALATLHARFDALLVHGDPRLCRLDQSFVRAAEIRIPVVHTGLVSERRHGDAPREERLIVASTGGGSEGLELARRMVAAFRRLGPRLPGFAMALFTGLFFTPRDIESLRAEAGCLPVQIEPFGPEFLDRLGACALSISRAGYNTCTNLLETGVRAVLVPSAARSDQRVRAARLKALGLAEVLDEPLPEPDAIAAAVLAGLAQPRPTRRLDLGGVERSCELLGTLLAAGRAA